MCVFSIIVPVYNAESSLKRCVDSILAQTFTNFELILIDDGSVDKSGYICDEYEQLDKRVRVFHKTNGGASSARNTGLENISGQWVTFCDADDYVFPDWLMNFRVESEKEYGLICQGIKCFQSLDNKFKGECCYCAEFDGNTREGIEILFKANILGFLVIKAFRANIIKYHNLKFNCDIKLREDLEFILRYLHKVKEIRSVRNCGYYYFVPDWNEKYSLNIDSSLSFYRNAFNSIKSLYINKNSLLRKEIREGYNRVLYIKYARSDKREQRIAYLKELASILKTDYDESQVYGLTKFLIRYDKTGVLADVFLLMHKTLKKKNFVEW